MHNISTVVKHTNVNLSLPFRVEIEEEGSRSKQNVESRTKAESSLTLRSHWSWFSSLVVVFFQTFM
jgi:hypothetical protein